MFKPSCSRKGKSSFGFEWTWISLRLLNLCSSVIASRCQKVVILSYLVNLSIHCLTVYHWFLLKHVRHLLYYWGINYSWIDCKHYTCTRELIFANTCSMLNLLAAKDNSYGAKLMDQSNPCLIVHCTYFTLLLYATVWKHFLHHLASLAVLHFELLPVNISIKRSWLFSYFGCISYFRRILHLFVRIVFIWSLPN